MKQKIVLFIATMILAVSVTACGQTTDEVAKETVFAEESVQEPEEETPEETVCEKNGHIWVEATCIESKTCSVCGETEGETLEHTLTEANYQQAPTCEVCGETVGEPLQADFEKYGLVCEEIIVVNGNVGKGFDSVTMCYDDTSKTIIGDGLIIDSETFVSNDTHPAKEGYEWKVIHLRVYFEGENIEYGWDVGLNFEDYYDVVGFDDTAIPGNEYNQFIYTVNYMGIDYPECEVWFENNHFGDEFYSTISVLAPVGYDGSVVEIRNRQTGVTSDEQHVFDLDNTDTLFFRLK